MAATTRQWQCAAAAAGPGNDEAKELECTEGYNRGQGGMEGAAPVDS